MISSVGVACQSVTLSTSLQRIYRMRKGVRTAARLIVERLERVSRRHRWVPLMVTLTYRPDVAWQPGHIAEYLERVKKWGKRRKCNLPYAWVMELTKVGVPHYHCIVWIPARFQLPKSDKQGWWPHGMTNTCRAKNAYGYLAKYASKGDHKTAFPKGARIHGVGGLTKEEAAIVAWWKLPKDLRRGAEGSERWRRAHGGGWICREGERCGQWIGSEWGLSGVASEARLVRLVKKQQGPCDPRLIRRHYAGIVVGAWKEWVYDQSLKLMQETYAIRDIDRVAYIMRVEQAFGIHRSGPDIRVAQYQ